MHLLTSQFGRFRALLPRLFASRRMTAAIIALFGLQAVWLAVSGAYSMAFDEYFHLGIIKQYAGGWLPFLHSPAAGQPAPFGAVGSDPSFLYHYLMSFPYRVVSWLTSDQPAQIITLRLIDVILVAVGLLLMHRLFRRIGLRRSSANYLLLMFSLLPVVPFLAAQLNYDTLLFPVAMAAALSSVGLVRTLSAGQLPSIRRLLAFVAVISFGSLIKYAFLPFAVAAFLFIFIFFVRCWRLLPATDRSRPLRVADLRTPGGIMLIALVGLGLLLGASRYGQNIVRYHTPTPECNQVISLRSCLSYDPFSRNYGFQQQNWEVKDSDLARYPFTWLHSMIRSLFFAVGPRQDNYPSVNPLPLAYGFGFAAGSLGLLAVILRLRWLWRRPVYRLLLCVTGLYLLALFAQNLLDFLNLAVPVAIQGRYALPVLPLALVLAAVSISSLLRRYRLPPVILPWLMTVGLICMLQGGGVLPFVLQAGGTWYWQQDTVQAVARTARRLLNPLVIGG